MKNSNTLIFLKSSDFFQHRCFGRTRWVKRGLVMRNLKAFCKTFYSFYIFTKITSLKTIADLSSLYFKLGQILFNKCNIYEFFNLNLFTSREGRIILPSFQTTGLWQTCHFCAAVNSCSSVVKRWPRDQIILKKRLKTSRDFQCHVSTIIYAFCYCLPPPTSIKTLLFPLCFNWCRAIVSRRHFSVGAYI